MNTYRHTATISDVAKMAGVSIATVSRVINGTTPVSRSATARVQQAIVSLDFVPHAAARMLASKRTNTLGLVLPEISGFYFSPLLRGIEQGLRGQGYDLLVHSSVYRQENGENTSVKLGEYNTDGLLVFASSMTDREIIRLHNLGLPLVLLHQSPPAGHPIPCVTIENKAGALKLVNHLIEQHGFHKIGFLAGPDTHEDSYWREMGYKEALNAHQIPIDPDLISFGGFEVEQALSSVHAWINSGVQIEAIFAGDDDAATGAITALHQAGLRVPQDVAVVGFDDIYVSQYLSPPLTTVNAPIERVGFTAAQQLIRLIRQEPVQQLTLLPTTLVIRRSCGCSAS